MLTFLGVLFAERVRFYSGFYVWITPVFLSWRQKEAACGMLRFCSAHRAAGVERSHGVLRSSADAGSLELFGLFVPAARVPEEVQKAIGKPSGGRIELEGKQYPFAATCYADNCVASEE